MFADENIRRGYRPGARDVAAAARYGQAASESAVVRLFSAAVFPLIHTRLRVHPVCASSPEPGADCLLGHHDLEGPCRCYWQRKPCGRRAQVRIT